MKRKHLRGVHGEPSQSGATDVVHPVVLHPVLNPISMIHFTMVDVRFELLYIRAISAFSAITGLVKEDGEDETETQLVAGLRLVF